MENVNSVFVEDTVQDFKRVAAVVKANKEVFVLLTWHGMVKQGAVKGVADVGLGDAVFESGGLKDDVFVHRDSVTYLAENSKGNVLRVIDNFPQFSTI
jgi:hypothetical protein